jgi:segregation and condensation protein A
MNLARDADFSAPFQYELPFVIDIDGFEGPLDLLLDLAKRQKVDLTTISILALTEQYLDYIQRAQALQLELAADYLVMAAWLAFLKSRLLLPDPPQEEEASATDMAMALALRLQRLQAIRGAADSLNARPRLQKDVFQRGQPEPVDVVHRPVWQASLFDLLSAYAHQRQKQSASHITLMRRPVWPLEEARAALQRLMGMAGEWVDLDAYLLDYIPQSSMRSTVIASSLSAALELAKEEQADLRQDRPFAPIYMKRRSMKEPHCERTSP